MGIFSDKSVNITVSNKTVVRIVLLIIASILGLRFFEQASRPLVLIFVSFFLAIALSPAVGWLTKKLKSKSRVRATAVAYLAVLTILIGMIILVVPPLVTQSTKFVRDLPSTIQDLQTQDSALAKAVKQLKIEDQLDEIGSDIAKRFTKSPQPIISTAGRVGSTVISVIAVLVMTFMMIVEAPVWLRKFWELQPDSKREHRKEVAYKMYKVVTGYVNGQLLIALIAGGFALMALLIASTIIGVSVNAVALAGIVILMGLIPMIGNTIGALLVVLISAFTSTPLAITMGIFFLVYQQIENVTIQPYIQSRNNNLTPLIVFIAALLGISFGGILGGLVAIPVVGVLQVLADDYISRHKKVN